MRDFFLEYKVLLISLSSALLACSQPLRLSLEDDPDADVNITVSTPIHINGVE